jgi:hypothetical protein
MQRTIGRPYDPGLISRDRFFGGAPEQASFPLRLLRRLLARVFREDVKHGVYHAPDLQGRSAVGFAWRSTHLRRQAEAAVSGLPSGCSGGVAPIRVSCGCRLYFTRPARASSQVDQWRGPGPRRRDSAARPPRPAIANPPSKGPDRKKVGFSLVERLGFRVARSLSQEVRPWHGTFSSRSPS